MAYTPIDPSRTAAKAPLDQALMDDLRENQVDFDDRITQIEAITITPQEQDVADLYATILSDPAWFSNEARLQVRRYHVFDSFVSAGFSSKYKSPFVDDLEGDQRERRLFYSSDGTQSGNAKLATSNNMYLQNWCMRIDKDEKIEFKIKKGEFFFGVINGIYNSTRSDNIEVLIDGQTPTALGLKDQNGNAAVDAFSSNSAVQEYLDIIWFYGLDGEEHIVTLTNNDISGSRDWYFNGIDIGYISRDYAVDNILKINDSKALVDGVSVDIAEETLTFNKSSGYGKTDIYVSDTSGNTRIIEGLEGAQTQIKPLESPDFTTNPTSLNVKNAHYFASKGACLMSDPWGNVFNFTYGSKTDTAGPQNMSLDDITWQKAPQYSYDDIESGWDDDGLNDLGTARYNFNINYWGEPQLEINSGNNKLDFEITIKDSTGTPQTTLHTATIADGWYCTDFVFIQDAILRAMEAAKPLLGTNARYYVRWDKVLQLFTLGVDGSDVVDISFKFGTGANVASSIHPSLGYDGIDLSGSKSYVAPTQTDYLLRRAYIVSDEVKTLANQDAKYMTSTESQSSSSLNAYAKTGIPHRTISNAAQATIKINTSEECAGLVIYLLNQPDGFAYGIHFTIDGREQMWLNDSGSSFRISNYPYHSEIVPYVITFPRGQHVIEITDSRMNPHATGAVGTVGRIACAGYKELYTKPRTEDLDSNEKILRAYNIAPLELYGTQYAFNDGLLYIPQPSGDDVNTVTESGSWGTETGHFSWNGSVRRSLSLGDYIEVDFNIDIDGGGFYFISHRDDSQAPASFYITNTGAINEATDRISNVQYFSRSNPHETYNLCSGIMGLKAGTYKARIRKEEPNVSRYLRVGGFVIINSDEPDPNKYHPELLANNGQGVCFPWGGCVLPVIQYSQKNLYYRNRNMEIRRQQITTAWYKNSNTDLARNREFTGLVTTEGPFYYSAHILLGNGSYSEAYAMCRSMVCRKGVFITNSNTGTAFVDGEQTPINPDPELTVKGGSASGSFWQSAYDVFKRFKIDCTMVGKVVTVSDTRGIKEGRPCMLIDNLGNKEQAIIENVTIGVSFETRRPLEVLNPADVVSVDFSGFHTMRYRNDTATSMGIGSWDYHPMTITESNFKRISTRGTRLETVSSIEAYGSGTIENSVIEPAHSDGTLGDITTSVYQLLNYGDGTGFTHTLDYPFVSSVNATHYLRVTSRKMVNDQIDEWDWEY
jgi:hypothetical protein